MSSSEEDASSPAARSTNTSKDNDNDNIHNKQKTIDEPNEDTIRVLVSTDNHLGYAENDAVRGQDSFAALEEVLYLAKHYQADMVLLAGDLFHQNKPSRRTLHKTMELFRRYCMGPNPIAIQILSDQKQNFRTGVVNYENEFYSVDLPVFSIHGNHDDPAREGDQLYAALDLLDCANLVNYVGRQEQVNQIEISPILMKKGETHLALYGLGSMRDERLNRMWRSQNLTFLRPETEGDVAWFNLFALHQNRDLGRGTKNCVHETMIPEWMDLVCWGHEHECCIEPQESVVGTFRITQPGSSVATSLTAGEAERKQVGILDIRGQQFRLLPIPLTQVRSFVLGELSLQQQRRLDPEDVKVEQKVAQILQDKVRVLIHDARERAQELIEAAKLAGNPLATMEGDTFPLKNMLNKPDEVLVRLKVEHSGFSALNNQRFGAKFIGEAANPTDILLFHRKKSAGESSGSKSSKLKDLNPIAPDELEEMNIEDLIEGELEQADKKMELFDEKRMGDALEEYVQKQQIQAIPDIVVDLLDKQQKRLMKRGPDVVEKDDDGGDDDEEMEQPKNKPKPKPATTRKRRAAQDDPMEEEEEEIPKRKKTTQKTTTRKPARSRKTMELDDDSDEVIEVSKPIRGGRTRKVATSYEESDNEEIEEVPPPKKRAARRTVNKKLAYSAADSDSDEVEVVEEEQPKKKKRVATTSRSKKSMSPTNTSSLMSQSQLSFATVQRTSRKTASRKKYTDDDSDDADLTPSRSYKLDDDWGAAKTDTFKS